MSEKIIMTSTAKCQDCYRCVRVCPVKAIRIFNGQAEIVDDKCIVCGTCVRECPQKAKTYKNDINKVLELLETKKVVASVAPSFAAVYGIDKVKLLPSALRQLGFYKIEETSIGAEAISNFLINETSANNLITGIGSACPVVINYIEKYKSDNIDLLMPVASPMIAHGRMIKTLSPEHSVVFIGPCIAKKAEALRFENEKIIDAVLTFSEMDELFKSKGIAIETCAESGFDSISMSKSAKLFALPGGLLKTIEKDNENYTDKVFHINGPNNTIDMLNDIDECDKLEILEPLFCPEGCVNGPGINSDKNIFCKRNDIISYSMLKKSITDINKYENVKIDLRVNYKSKSKSIDMKIPTDRQILEIYEKTGKSNPERRLDCSACGYKSCRENATAIFNKMAEAEMCFPYMRLMAKKRTDRIMDSSPNGMIILNNKLRIIAVNSSFKKYFSCSDNVCGKYISSIFDPADYEKVIVSEKRLESMILYKDKEFHQIIYYLEEEKQLIGIYVDVAAVKITEAKINHLRKTTSEQAKLLLDHQIEMAQKLTKFLGENTAKSEALLEKLFEI